MDRRTDDLLEFQAWFDLATDGTGATGLTVTVDVYNPARTKVVADGAATEVGGGLYEYNHTMSPASAGAWRAVFKTASATVAKKHAPTLLYVARGVASDYTAARAAKLDYLAAGDVTIINPLSSDGAYMELVRGDDYCLIDNRELSFSSSDWPNLALATPITLTVRRKPGNGADAVLFAVTDTTGSRVTSSTGGSQTVVFEPRSSDTASVISGTNSMKYDAQAVLASTGGGAPGHVITLVTGLGGGIEDQTRST